MPSKPLLLDGRDEWMSWHEALLDVLDTEVSGLAGEWAQKTALDRKIHFTALDRRYGEGAARANILRILALDEETLAALKGQPLCNWPNHIAEARSAARWLAKRLEATV